MKRYALDWQMQDEYESPNGEWVKYEDAAAFISEGTMRWIPCSERMPNSGAFVLMATDNYVLTASYGSNGGSPDHFRYMGAIYHPTHWMPLPEAPNGK